MLQNAASLSPAPKQGCRALSWAGRKQEQSSLAVQVQSRGLLVFRLSGTVPKGVAASGKEARPGQWDLRAGPFLPGKPRLGCGQGFGDHTGQFRTLGPAQHYKAEGQPGGRDVPTLVAAMLGPGPRPQQTWPDWRIPTEASVEHPRAMSSANIVDLLHHSGKDPLSWPQLEARHGGKACSGSPRVRASLPWEN